MSAVLTPVIHQLGQRLGVIYDATAGWLTTNRSRSLDRLVYLTAPVALRVDTGSPDQAVNLALSTPPGHQNVVGYLDVIYQRLTALS